MFEIGKNSSSSEVSFDMYFKISSPYILRFGNEGLIKIFSQIMTDLINELIDHEGVYRTSS